MSGQTASRTERAEGEPLIDYHIRMTKIALTLDNIPARPVSKAKNTGALPT